MNKIIKIGQDYYVEFYGNGLRFQKKTGSNYEDAVRMLSEIERLMNETHVGADVLHVSIKQFFLDSLAEFKLTQTERSYDRYLAAVRHFQKFLKEYHPALEKLYEITPKVVEFYRESLLRDQRKFRAAITNKLIGFTLLILSDVFERGVRVGHINGNPCVYTKIFDGLPLTPRISLTDLECDTLLSAAGAPLRNIIQIILSSGLTLSELLPLRWEAIDLQENTMHIDMGMARRRAVRFDHSLKGLFLSIREKSSCGERSLLFSDPSGGLLSRDAVVEGLRQVSQKVFQKDIVRPSSLRNTFVKRLLDKGISLMQIYRILGLTDVARIMYYVPFLHEKV